jgi:CelD/BcsL family acetyltransferase involved in cellulose biosynthesis
MLDLGPQWDDLVCRASPNVFMNPAALNAAHQCGYAEIKVLLAYDERDPGQLLGLWALEQRRISALWPATLQGLPYYYAFLSSPVLDPDYADVVMHGFLAAIAREQALPKLLHLQSFDAATPGGLALQRALSTGGQRQMVLDESLRPQATRDKGIKRSGSTRKKLRQDWNRLAGAGQVEIRNDRAPAAVAEAFETFLALELASWKGSSGTAILSNAADAGFARRLIGNLAERGDASVALLCVDGRAVAAQVLLYCGRSAYTWKVAYDAAFGRFSPGALLIDRIADGLLSGTAIDAIDSCAAASSFMATQWDGRRPMLELLVDLGPRRSLGFQLESVRLRTIRALRRWRDRWRARRAGN